MGPMLPVFINQVSLEPQLIVIYTLLWLFMCYWGFPGGSVVKKKKKNLPANARDTDSIPGLGRSPGEGNGNPLQYYCLGNPMDRGSHRQTVHGVAKESDTTKQQQQYGYYYAHPPNTHTHKQTKNPKHPGRVEL